MDMGMEFEFNWYIVLKDENVTNAYTHNKLDEGLLEVGLKYQFVKSGLRIYPMETPLPLIYNGRCLGMACISKLELSDGATTLIVEPILVFQKDDTLAKYYEDSFKGYKEEQQAFDDGGKVDIRSVVNPTMRMRV